MRFMIMVKASQDSEAGKLPSQELLAAMGQYNEALVQAGVLLSGEGLHPSSKGARVRVTGIELIRTRNRQIVEGHANADTLGLLTQIGITPEPVKVPPFFF
jgi:YCII-related domain